MMKNSARHSCRFSPSRRQIGLSLVELMISLTIGLVLLAGMTTLIVQQSGARREMEKSGRQIENGRYAMEILHGDIEHAGFYGEYAPQSGVTFTTPDPCQTAINALGWDHASSPVAMPVPIQGYAGAAADPTPGACLRNYQANTAVLAVRRTSSTTTDTAAAIAGRTYLQTSRCISDTKPFMMAQGSFDLRLKDCATPAPLYGYIVRIYYISQCSDVTAANACADTIPTLKMVDFSNGGQTVIPLVEGIENMQFEYGLDTTDDGAPDAYTAAPAAAEWENVMAVRVNLLARNNEITTGYTDTKTYNLGAAASSVAPGGSFKRHAYSQLVRATNPSGRRE